ncbi:hypothetical protein [Neobacillus jeddahensis]|uniref:hypothetical protein n=1 Tax=Neobacillus jeddahensis TaxID=1461580 RepID=UPI00058FB62A|nr:hypothetical protein [Neobacillus jeddahensis]
MKAYFHQHPLLFTIFVFCSSRLVGLVIIQIILIVVPGLSLKEDLGWVLQLLYMIMAVLFIYGFGQQKDAGINFPPDNKEWLIWIPTLVFYHLQFRGGSASIYLAISYAFTCRFWGSS